jgi:predicted glycoside hydrolase/deacetylase ChbG (UPF0249 family)
MNMRLTIVAYFFSFFLTMLFSCSSAEKSASEIGKRITWAEKLGFPEDSKVIILHADDGGMCEEANRAIEKYLRDGRIQSTSAMAPCPGFDKMAAWAVAHPDKDIGLHLTLTSEWKTYRWGPVADIKAVPDLLDPDGFMWHEVVQVLNHATAKEVETEVRAQIEKAIGLGMKPDHIDTHMGTLFASPAYTQVYLKVAEEYKIPAMVINLEDDAVLRRFQEQGYPINENTRTLLEQYSMPQLDDFYAVPAAQTYQEKIDKFYELIKLLNPGLTEIIFHPSIDTETLKSITNSWQQRVWESEMFSDPQVIKFLKNEGILFTNWIEIMKRHQ